MAYLTESELAALQTSGLDRKTPYVMTGISQSQLSIARHYGGIMYEGVRYIYYSLNDELIRKDVVQWVEKRRRAETKATKEGNRQETEELF
jgi:hypothetical protein